MRIPLAIASLLIIAFAFLACSGHGRYHESPLGDPAAYDAHFPDMDGNGDGLLDRTEFKTRFPQSDDHVYEALDLNNDGAVDHDEWHEFKAAHGIKHHS